MVAKRLHENIIPATAGVLGDADLCHHSDSLDGKRGMRGRDPSSHAWASRADGVEGRRYPDRVRILVRDNKESHVNF